MAARKVMLVSPDFMDSLMRKDKLATSLETAMKLSLDKSMEEILNDSSLQESEKIHRYNQVLQRFLTIRDDTVQSQTPLYPSPSVSTISISPSAAVESETVGSEKTQELQQDEKEPEQKTFDPLSSISKTNKSKAEKLLQKLLEGDDGIKWNSGGDFFINDRKLPGASITRMLDRLFSNRKSEMPPGMSQLIHILANNKSIKLDWIKNAEIKKSINMQRRLRHSADGRETRHLKLAVKQRKKAAAAEPEDDEFEDTVEETNDTDRSMPSWYSLYKR